MRSHELDIRVAVPTPAREFVFSLAAATVPPQKKFQNVVGFQPACKCNPMSPFCSVSLWRGLHALQTTNEALWDQNRVAHLPRCI